MHVYCEGHETYTHVRVRVLACDSRATCEGCQVARERHCTCASSSKLDTPPSIESDVNDPRKSLSGMLEGAADVQYEARGDIPGVRVIRQDEDKEEWIPVVVKEPDDGSEEFDAEYLNGCKHVKFFMSESGPSFSIHCGNLRFPTPVACRTRSRLKDNVIS